MHGCLGQGIRIQPAQRRPGGTSRSADHGRYQPGRGTRTKAAATRHHARTDPRAGQPPYRRRDGGSQGGSAVTTGWPSWQAPSSSPCGQEALDTVESPETCCKCWSCSPSGFSSMRTWPAGPSNSLSVREVSRPSRPPGARVPRAEEAATVPAVPDVVRSGVRVGLRSLRLLRRTVGGRHSALGGARHPPRGAGIDALRRPRSPLRRDSAKARATQRASVAP